MNLKKLLKNIALKQFTKCISRFNQLKLSFQITWQYKAIVRLIFNSKINNSKVNKIKTKKEMASEANIPIKIAEISANRYNEQILHKVSLLKNYRSNFEKALKLKDFERLKKDQINSTKTVKQMKTLLQDLEQLKQKVLEDDRDKFDKLTGDAKADALKEIRNHLGKYF